MQRLACRLMADLALAKGAAAPLQRTNSAR